MHGTRDHNPMLWRLARKLWATLPCAEIARRLQLPRTTVASWARRADPPWPKKQAGRTPKAAA